MKFKRHILMTSAAATLAFSLGLGAHAYAQEAAPADDAQTVVVTGIRKSLQSALKQKRSSDVVEEVITAEDIGKFPDKNVADSLSHVSGVTVTTGSPTAGGFGENERVSIRGTDPELNLTLMDGHNVATGDWFVLDQTAGGRSFNYSMLPSEVVGSVEVIKASSANLPEGGVGGTVDVHVRKPLDLPANTFSGSAQAMYATLADKTSPQVSGMYSWKNDAHTFGVLVGAFYQEREFRRDGQEVIGYAAVSDFAGTGNTVYVPSLIGDAYFQQKRVREGGNVMLQWKVSDDLEVDVSGLYTYMKANNENHNFMMWGSKLGATTPSSYTTTVGADGNTYLTSATWDASSTPTIVQDDIFRDAHSSTSDINIDATWTPGEKWTLKGQIGFTSGIGETDDTAAWETYWTDVGASYTLGKNTAVSYSGLPTDTSSAAYLNNHYSWSWGGKVSSPDRELYAKFDADYVVGDGLVKDILFGARHTDHYRAVNYYAYSWAGNSASGQSLATVYTGDTTPSDYGSELGGLLGYSYSNADAVYSYEDSNYGGRVFGFYGNSSYAVREKTNGYYIMGKLGGDKWRGNVGVRAVHTDSTAIQYTTTATDDAANVVSSVFGTYYEVDTKHDYWDILPSANLVYKASDDFLIRAGVSKVMTRPGYSQLAGYFYLVDSNYTGSAGGNPDLQPYRAWQYNLSAEYYYAPEALISIGLFDLNISNYISTETYTSYYVTQQTQLDYGTGVGHDFTMTGPVNGGGAKNAGIEVSWQQPIAYGFGVLANATVSDSHTTSGNPLIGTSKLTYNLSGYYEQGKISTRLSYNYRSHFYLGISSATPIYQDNYATLDGTFSYALTPHISIALDAQNLLHAKLYYYNVSKDIPRAYYDNGQSFYLGVRFKY